MLSQPIFLCATTRLAQQLRAKQPVDGGTVWQTPLALTLTQWLSGLAEEALLSGAAMLPAPLDPFAERLLWEKIVAASLIETSLLFDIQGMAASAAEAHAISVAWNIVPDHHSCSAEGELFIGWQKTFRKHCRQHGWLDVASFQAELIKLIEAGQLTLPKQIFLCGFDRHTALEKRLFAALNTHHCRVEKWPKTPVHRSTQFSDGEFVPTLVSCADSAAECAAVAAWAKQHLVENSDCRLGVVVPDLAGVRDRLAFVLEDQLHPTGVRPDQAETPRYFNFSLGRSLADQPLIRVALELLALGPSRAKVEQARLSALLLDIGWSAGVAEADERAQCDLVMRQNLPYFTTLRALVRLCDSLPPEKQANCPQSIIALSALIEVMGGAKPVLPSVWSGLFERALSAVAWPGDRPLSSYEFQACRVFKEELAGFGKLDHLLGVLPLNEAVRRLSQLCRQRVFQAETKGVPAIQVLGTLESTGLDFDALWVMGMNDDRWPPPPRPNPLLSAEALRLAGAAHASAEVELEFASQVHARLLQAAPEVIFSYALADGSRVLRASPLIAGLLKLADTSDNFSPSPSQNTSPNIETLAVSWASDAGHDCELVDDALAPPVTEGEKVSGGSSLLRAQAICPAWAYYQYRLGADQMDQPVEGLDPAARGTLVHAALEAFWNVVRDSLTLASLDTKARQLAIEAAVSKAITHYEATRRISLPKRFSLLETQRLENLLALWLDVEGRRELPFSVIACEQKAQLEIEGIKVNMVVDRIDQLADGRQVIIDYKTGAAIDFKNWAEQRITEPQLPIYAALVAEEVAAVVFAKVLLDRPAFSGVADEKGVLPGVQGIADEKQKIFDPAIFPDWIAVVMHWRERLHAIAREVKEGEAGVRFADEKDLHYCEVKPLLRLAERDRLWAAAKH